MGKWLSKIDPRRKKQFAQSKGPQPYEVLCRCGERAVGIRMPRYQQVICKQCGEPLFVLPANVYPSPPPPTPAPEPVSETPDEEDVLAEAAEVEKKPTSTDGLLGELAVESKGLTKKAKRKQDATQKRRNAGEKSDGLKSRRARKRAEREAAKQEQQANPLLAKVSLRQRIRKQLSPFRLTVAAAILVVAGTAWWQVRSRSIDSARVRFDVARKQAVRFIEEGKTVEAEPLLAEAVQAADLIDRQDDVARRMRQLLSEANVINNLPQSSLFDAISMATSASREDMADVLMAEMGDRWIVIDTWVTPRRRNDNGIIDYGIDVPLMLNDVVVAARVETTAFDVLDIGKSGKPVVFAAKIQSCEVLGRGKNARLAMRFDPESVRIWASERNYKTLGFEDDEVPEHLSQQARLLGVEE